MDYILNRVSTRFIRTQYLTIISPRMMNFKVGKSNKTKTLYAANWSSINSTHYAATNIALFTRSKSKTLFLILTILLS